MGLVNIVFPLPLFLENKQDHPSYMAVAPASMAESIVILDDDEEESPQPSSSSAPSLSQRPANHIMPLKAQQPAPTHITQSPFATAKKDSHVLQAENQRLFTEVRWHDRCRGFSITKSFNNNIQSAENSGIA